MLAAVKANAYGHGSVEVARMIERTGCADWLGVATVPEGVELRDAGVRLPILKLSHALASDEIAAALDADITLAVTDAANIDAVAAVASELGREASVHLKIDTGMRRIGAWASEAPELARRVDATGVLKLQGVFSHMPVSDTGAGRAFTNAQIARFKSATDAVGAARGPVELRHLAASAGVLMHPDAWFDMVRPGIVCYGNLPDPASISVTVLPAESSTGQPAVPRVLPPVPLLPGMTWTTAVSFVKRVAEGETVSYGRTWTAPADTWIATIPVGYADGYSRLLSNRGRLLIAGRSYPIAGRICMDQTMIDLGPTTSVAVGDEVVLMGRSGDAIITCAELADLMGTITYEVTCLVGARVVRATDDI